MKDENSNVTLFEINRTSDISHGNIFGGMVVAVNVANISTANANRTTH